MQPRSNPSRWRRKLLVGSGAALVGVVAMPTFAGIAGAQDVDPVQINLDNVYILLSAVLVIFMQAGFALVEAGLTRAKSVANIMMKNMIDFCAGGIAFAAVGFAIAYGGSLDGFGMFFGADGFFLGDGAFTYGNLTVPVFFTFQVAFAATTATIVSGAMAERTKFAAYLIYSFVISLIIYPVVVRWQWGGGWLYQGAGPLPTPYHDFAGSSIVHMVGGVAAFWGAKLLGARIGKYGPDGKPRAILGHNVPFAILGCFILLVGWYGFNPGSELAADAAIGGIAVTTTLAACAGALAAMATVWLKTGKPDVGMTGNGLLAGLVGITASTAAVTVQAAIIIGALSGVLVVFAVFFFDNVVKVDDPVGAISVHGVCGTFGVLAVGIFANGSYGAGWNGSDVEGVTGVVGGEFGQLGAQAVGVAVLWTVILGIAYGFFKIQNALTKGGIRSAEEDELVGLDLPEMGVLAYPEFGGGGGLSSTVGSSSSSKEATKV
jgi:ammonium transporter, Amt family